MLLLLATGCDVVLGLDERPRLEAGVEDAATADAMISCDGTSIVRSEFASDLDLARHWDKRPDSATIEIIEGAVAFRPGLNAAPTIRTNSSHDFTGAIAQIKLVEAMTIDHGGMYFRVVAAPDTTHCFFEYDYEPSNFSDLKMTCSLGGTVIDVKEILYDPVPHRYLRMQHVTTPTSRMVFSTSPDAVEWAERHSISVTFALTAVALTLTVVTDATNTDSSGLARFDDFELCRP